MKYEYKKLQKSDFHDGLLDSFNRYQETKRVVYMQDNSLLEKDDYFIENWDKEKKIKMINYFKNLVEKNGIFIGVFFQENLIGFGTLENIIFNDYINLHYLHISNEFRNRGLGKILFNYLSDEALSLGAKMLYISTHPSVETQNFYRKMGCVLTKNINPEILALEPFDIQLEKIISAEETMYFNIKFELEKYDKITTKEVIKIVSNLYKKMPKNDVEFLNICSLLVNEKNMNYFSIMTLFIKKRKSLINKKYIDIYDKWVNENLDSWWRVDQLCYRVLNPVIESDDSLYEYILKWSKSDNQYVRRASLVSMIRAQNKYTVYYDYLKMIRIVNDLMFDDQYYVKKGLGWVLKCAYLSYPKEIEKYLRDNVLKLDRGIYRYALEHIENPLRNELINLNYKENN